MFCEIKKSIELVRSKCKVGTPILIWVCDEEDDYGFDNNKYKKYMKYNGLRLPYLKFVPGTVTENDRSKREALTKSIELIDKYERRVRKSNHIKVNHLDLCNDIKFCVRSFF